MHYVIIFLMCILSFYQKKISLLQNRRPESKIKTHESNNI